MTTGAWLQVVGGAFQLLGLVVAGRGVARARAQFASERLGLWGWLLNGLVSPGGMLRPGQPERDDTIEVYGTAFGPTVVARPAQGADRETVERFLVERVAWLQEEAGRLREAVGAEGQERANVVRSLEDVVDRQTTEIREDIAAGLATEARGLWLAGLGTALQAIGAGIAP
ncbi:hypothetical protein ACIRQF_07080 [Streptomyces sp. NPDC101191]|uniref:hypothetical protein n=1 Tax=Streptomyces sp. NPDC101191 TaxID=3366126 RepID=UPI003816B750